MVRDLDLTSQQVWGLTKTDRGWSTALEAALTAARRADLEHGTNAAYVHGSAGNAESTSNGEWAGTVAVEVGDDAVTTTLTVRVSASRKLRRE